MTLRAIEVRERRDSFRPHIHVRIVGNGRQAGIDAAIDPPQQTAHTREPPSLRTPFRRMLARVMGGPGLEGMVRRVDC